MPRASIPKSSGALDWRRSIYGTFPEHDVVLEDDGVNLPVLDANLCGKCQEITWEALSSTSGYLHYKRKVDVTAAARDGCRLCLWICRSLDFTSHLISPDAYVINHITLFFDFYNFAIVTSRLGGTGDLKLSLFTDVPSTDRPRAEKEKDECKSL